VSSGERETPTIKKVTAIGAAVVLASAASLGLVAEATSTRQDQSTPQPQGGELYIANQQPGILPEETRLVKIARKLEINPKEGLLPEQFKPQTSGMLPGANISSHGRSFKRG